MLEQSRRTALNWLTLLVAAVIAAMLAVPGVGYLCSPLRRRGAEASGQGFLDAGVWSDVVEGAPQLVAIEMTHQDGWVESRVRHSIWVTKTGTDSAEVLSPICPHLGCPINFDAAKQQFACPCHVSFFDRRGEVLSGPSPRAMDPLDYEIRNGRLWIRWVDFRQGTAKREPVSI